MLQSVPEGEEEALDWTSGALTRKRTDSVA